MIGVEIAPQNIAPTLKAIKQLEPDTIKRLRADLKGKLGGIMSQVQSAIPTQAPLSGMNNRGRLKWGKPKVSISFTPASKFSGKDYHPLVSLSISGAGFKMAELAGSRDKPGQWKSITPEYTNGWGTVSDHRITTQGFSLIDNLRRRFPTKGKAGRFAFSSYIRIQEDVAGVVMGILNEFVSDFNRRWKI